MRQSVPRALKSGAWDKERITVALQRWLLTLGAGLILTSGLALLAVFLRTLPGLHTLSPLILAILLGILVRNIIGVPQVCQPGITFSLKRILRLAIVLLGLQLSFTQLLAINSIGLAIVIITLFSTFYFTCWVGKQLGIPQQLAQLIAAGTAICGASAVVATSATVNSSDEDTAYAVSLVTVFGTASMLLYPLLPTLLHLTPQAFGLWCGASIHEVAQVIAAAFQVNPLSGEIASVSKLSRVVLLAPTILMLGLAAVHTRNSSADSTQPGLKTDHVSLPWFVLYFIVLVLLNSLNIFPEVFKNAVLQANQWLLAVSLTAMGLETKLQYVKQSGWKPIFLGILSWLFISIFSLSLIKIFY